MSKFTLEIKCENAAFEDDRAGEVARILRDAAGKIAIPGAIPGAEYTLRDINGNRVGYFKWDHEG